MCAALSGPQKTSLPVFFFILPALLKSGTVKFISMDHLFTALDRLYYPLFDFDIDKYGEMIN